MHIAYVTAECPSIRACTKRDKTWHYITHVILAMRIVWNVGRVSLRWPLVMHLTATGKLGKTLLSAHITTGEYVARYVTSLFSESNITM